MEGRKIWILFCTIIFTLETFSVWIFICVRNLFRLQRASSIFRKINRALMLVFVEHFINWRDFPALFMNHWNENFKFFAFKIFFYLCLIKTQNLVSYKRGWRKVLFNSINSEAKHKRGFKNIAIQQIRFPDSKRFDRFIA